MTYHIHHVSDSFATMRDIGDMKLKRCGVIITDPPYPEDVQNNMCSGSLVGNKSVPKYELEFDPLSKTQRQWVMDGVRIAHRWVVTFCALEDVGRLKDIGGKYSVRGCVWYKSNAMGQLTADRPATSYEAISLFHDPKVKKKWNGKGSYGIWRCPGSRGKENRHPNEKPLALCLKLVALFSERDELVLDPFCGSGAIGEACLRLGRKYEGWDTDMVWCERSARRLVQPLAPVSDEDALRLCRMSDAAAAEDRAFLEGLKQADSCL